MIKRIVLALLFVAMATGLYYRELVSYGWMQAKGQLEILWNVQDVQDVLNNPSYPDSLKSRIRLIEEIKQFGYDSLGIKPSNNYTTFYDQKGKPILWVITASEKYKLESYEWHFPIIGTFPYKGFFDSTRAVAEIDLLKSQGYDTDMGEVSAWSTLGYAKDPILSGMLERSVGSLANLILHELTHGTLFVKNNLSLNENLATFVGDLGAERFLKSKYGPESKELKQYEYSKRYRDAYSTHIMHGTRQLDSLYATFTTEMGEKHKDSLKFLMISHILSTTDTLLGNVNTFSKIGRNEDQPLPNNAYFTGFKTYKEKQNIFKEEFERDFDADFNKYMQYLKEKYPSM
jgi:predicted aminopeptidase